MTSQPSSSAPDPLVVAVGERIRHTVRYTKDDIRRFAQLTLDRNPVHHDEGAAASARHGRIIASGQQTSALMSGLAATHFSRGIDGLPREMLCLNFNFAFRAPVFADVDVHIEWVVREVEWNASLAGYIAQLDGQALAGETQAIIARGTVLVREAEEPSSAWSELSPF